jgi:hypothetical protein
MVIGTGSLTGSGCKSGLWRSYVSELLHDCQLIILIQAQKRATFDAPPTSNHFNDDKKLRIPPAPSVAFPVPPVHNAAAAPTPFLGLDPTQALMQQLVHQNAMMVQMLNPLAHGVPIPGSAFPLAMVPPPPPQTQPAPGFAMPSPSNVTKLPRPISLQEFCLRYDISDSDLAKLESLEVRLGDRAVEKLEAEYWKEVGFSRLGWVRFLGAHKQFLTDVTNSAWN